MGREVRMVPATWVHPVDAAGEYTPLYGGSFSKATAEWDDEFLQWEAGFVRDYSQHGIAYKPRAESDLYSSTYPEYAGARPVADDYMPDWTDAECTHLMMYEDTSEGTPLSPPMETPEALAKYLADTGASSFGSDTATYDQWLRMIKAGWAPSAMFSPQTGLISGVAAALDPVAQATAPLQISTPLPSPRP